MKPHVMWFESYLSPPGVICTCGWFRTSYNSDLLIEESMKHKSDTNHQFVKGEL